MWSPSRLAWRRWRRWRQEREERRIVRSRFACMEVANVSLEFFFEVLCRDLYFVTPDFYPPEVELYDREVGFRGNTRFILTSTNTTQSSECATNSE